MDIPAVEPAAMRAGDTLQWQRILPDWPASDGWQLGYVYVGPGQMTLTAGTDGDGYIVTVDAASSAAWQPGDYAWQATVTRGAERHTVGAGRMTVQVNLAAQVAGYDSRSHARRVLDAIHAVLENRANSAELATEINGRKLQYIPIADLLSLRDRYLIDVRREDAALGLCVPVAGVIRVRFGA